MDRMTKAIGFGVILSGLAGAPAGCGTRIGDLIFRGLTVELYNDTDFEVDPGILYDDDAGFFAGLLPAERLDTGRLRPYQTLVFRLRCSEVGTLLSNDAEQFLDFGRTAEADDSPTLQRDEHYECGDVIRFRFEGEGSTFRVVASVNDRVID
jgi:hypothetical protein